MAWPRWPVRRAFKPTGWTYATRRHHRAGAELPPLDGLFNCAGFVHHGTVLGATTPPGSSAST
jgi:hypothetical protein